MKKVFLNDKIVDADSAGVSVNDSGFLYGMGLFETMRAAGGRVFAIDDHLQRLLGSAKTLSINTPYDKKYIANAIEQTLKANDLSDARIRLTLTAGPISEADDNKGTLLISATEFQPYPPEYYQKGVTVVLTECRQNQTDPMCGHKTLNFAARLMALNQAHKKRATEALWFTIDNRLAEGCVSNVFIVSDSVVYTPPVSTPVLPGIARKTVCKIAEKESIELIEKDLTVQDLLAADEVFLTNMIMLILPVIAVEAHTIGEGKPGPVTKKLTDSFNEILSAQ